MINLVVPHIAQTSEYDCWYAALRMLVKFRHGPTAEPLGHPRAELEGALAQSIRDNIVQQARNQNIEPGVYAVRQRLQRNPPRGLRADEFEELMHVNGLVSPILPVRFDAQAQTGGFTANQLEILMRIHGPLWCAFGYGHIVVAKGVTADGRILVNNPQGQADEPYPILNFNRLLVWTPSCLMYLPPIPNVAAFLG